MAADINLPSNTSDLQNFLSNFSWDNFPLGRQLFFARQLGINNNSYEVTSDVRHDGTYLSDKIVRLAVQSQFDRMLFTPYELERLRGVFPRRKIPTFNARIF